MSRVDEIALSPAGVVIMRIAQQEAIRLYHNYLGTEHVLIALTRAVGGYTERMLERLDRQPAYVRAHLRARSGVGSARQFMGFHGTMTPRLQRALQAALQAADARGLGERELLLAVLNGGPGVAVRALTEKGPPLEEIVAGVEADAGPEATQVRVRAEWPGLDGRDEHDALQDALDEQDDVGAHQGAAQRAGEALEARPPAPGSSTPILDRFGHDLTAAARQGKLREAIGRRKTRDQIIQALVQQHRNVPVLVSEAGVGKTAIVEGLAARLAQEDTHTVIPLMRGKRIIELRMTDLVAGAGVRGDLEARIRGVLRECAAHPEIILFIDEIHTLVGAGDTRGNLDAAQLLKPALANGELRVIGATTPAEYQRFIAKDAALERRMQPIRVEELEPQQTEDLLRAMRSELEERYMVQIRPEAVVAAVELSVRYLPERRLPDKALSLLHEACAYVLVGGGKQDSSESHGLLSMDASSAEDLGPVPVTAEIIAEIVARRLGVPVGEIAASDRDRILTLEQVLATRIKAQDDAVHMVAQAVRAGWSGLRNPNRPRAVLLLCGPTGVGKTETARALADILFAGPRAQHMLTLDMAEFSQEHMIAQLLGAPAGYVGYEQEGRLTGWLRQHPYSVVLLDEIEKAHPTVLRLLLGLFEEGRLTDGQGTTVSGREALFIMTTNWMPRLQEAELDAEFEEPGEPMSNLAVSEAVLRKQLGPVLSPEVVNRIDRIVPYRPLDRTALMGVAQLQIDALQQRLEAIGVTLWVDAPVLNWLVENGSDAASNARSLARLIDRAIAEPIVSLEARGKLMPGAQITVAVESSHLTVAI